MIAALLFIREPLQLIFQKPHHVSSRQMVGTSSTKIELSSCCRHQGAPAFVKDKRDIRGTIISIKKCIECDITT